MAESKAAQKRGEDAEPYEPKVYDNGDTRKQLLARSRYLLFKSREKWTESQKARAKILFDFNQLSFMYNQGAKIQPAPDKVSADYKLLIFR